MVQPDLVDITVEALEVLLHHILYVREVYPSQIFKKFQIYNAPVFVSIFPPLNSYIYNVMRTARDMLRNNELTAMEVVLYRSDFVIYERYSFNLVQQSVETPFEDTFLLGFEEQLRSALYKMAERLNLLEKLPRDTKFKVQFHTSQAGLVRISQNPHYQDFPWLQQVPLTKDVEHKLSILPLSAIYKLGVEVMAEVM